MPMILRTIIVVVALSVTQLVGWGATFWLPAVTGPSMSVELALDLTSIMAGPTAMLLMMALISWPLSGAFERYGARPIMAVGSLLGAVGLLTLSMSIGASSYFLSWIILGCAGACMLTTPAQIAVTEVAGDKARHALGILILAGGLTSTIMWPLTAILQAEWGWRATTMFYAALLLVICTPLHWKTLARRPKPIEKADNASEPTAIDHKQFVLLAASFAANGFFTWGFALTIIILFEAKGLDHASAVSAAAFIGVSQWAGRMVDFVGGTRWSGLTSGLAGSLLFPFSFIILLLSDSTTGAILFAALYGLASGITAIARATLPLQLFPAGAYARASARMAVPLNLAFATAPPAFMVIMTSASPQFALWVAFFISIFSFVMLLSLSVVHRHTALGVATEPKPEV